MFIDLSAVSKNSTKGQKKNHCGHYITDYSVGCIAAHVLSLLSVIALRNAGTFTRKGPFLVKQTFNKNPARHLENEMTLQVDTLFLLFFLKKILNPY